MRGGKPTSGRSQTITRFKDAAAGPVVTSRAPANKSGFQHGMRVISISTKRQDPMQCSKYLRELINFCRLPDLGGPGHVLKRGEFGRGRFAALKRDGSPKAAHPVSRSFRSVHGTRRRAPRCPDGHLLASVIRTPLSRGHSQGNSQ